MRLLERTDTGDVRFKNFPNEDLLPQYAILSHTWGVDGEEVSYTDILHGTAKDKLGYTKIEFCRDQAWNSGLRFFWVDTCCIDKSNSPELQESINCMFRCTMGSIFQKQQMVH
ncbi:Vegetative incompatibility protein HET-E-1 [Sporothrix eucalyptigena]|uniref:Vegetative incompatibility protein HET-E-1 n=1 Tax=Sporothrix eucalyptigena TaxID=1812306 RepID=A0ABP0CE29_9PEZI